MCLPDADKPMPHVKCDGAGVFRIHRQPRFVPAALLALFQPGTQQMLSDAFVLMARLNIERCNFSVRGRTCGRIVACTKANIAVYSVTVFRNQQELCRISQNIGKAICSELGKGTIGKETVDPFADIAADPNFNRQGGQAGAVAGAGWTQGNRGRGWRKYFLLNQKRVQYRRTLGAGTSLGELKLSGDMPRGFLWAWPFCVTCSIDGYRHGERRFEYSLHHV